MVDGTIFNVQKYSVHDGPGIRTTVFLKGCPLNCWWCHNPESQELKQQTIFWKNKCIGCGDCFKGCPNHAIAFDENSFTKDELKCNLCENCTKNCPTEALEMVGKKMTVGDVMKEIEKDRIFYDESGGGVTFSGGEPLMQPEFLDSLLEDCKNKGMHTTLDTSGYASWETLSKISDKVDLFLYDIKHMDDEKHKELTGVSNKLILDNLKKLVLTNKKIWIRVPIIPQINDEDENILKTGEFIASLNLRDVFILPYHNIAIDKYARLDKNYKLIDVQTPSNKHMNEIAEKLKAFGLNVKIGG